VRPPTSLHALGASLALLAAAAWSGACAESDAPGRGPGYGPYVAPPAPAADVFEVPPPPLSEGVFPCTDCHDPEIPVNRKRRELKLAHQDIVLHHAEGQRWCLDCHDAEDRDQLHLANGETVPFEESYRLCGQCHGDKYRDWKAGVHGRRTGDWNGRKTYLLCVSCHNAHAPAFAPLKPEPPPIPPRRTP
jgi:Doubled CXXCH motif (Paired_CXXCH_1)